MGRPKKDYVPLNIRLSSDIDKMLDEYCKRTGATKTSAVELALKKFIEDFNNSKR